MKIGTNKALLIINLIRGGYSEKEASKCVIMLYALKNLYGNHIEFIIRQSRDPVEQYDYLNRGFLPFLLSRRITCEFTVFNQGAGIINNGDTWYVGDFQGDTNDESWLEEVKGVADYYSRSYY